MMNTIRSRWLLIGLVAAGQLLALLTASVWLVNWLDLTVDSIVRQRIRSSTVQNARQIGLLIEELGLGDITPGTLDWARLQGIVERIELSYRGFLCIIDDGDGNVICHPNLRRDPDIAVHQLGTLALDGAGPGMQLNAAGGGAAPDSGTVQLPDGAHLIAVKELNGLHAKLLVHQPDGPIRAVVEQFTGRVRVIAMTLSIMVVVFTTALTAAIVRRYEHRLAHINMNLEQLVGTRTEALLKSRGAVIFGMAKLAESRDDQTGQHLERIRQYVLILAQQLRRDMPEMTAEFIDTLAETASLHDIGKVGIPDSVLLHPGPLTDDQRAIIRRHPLIGGDTLLALKKRWGDDPFLVTACEVVFAHHERWDGKGYPFGLAGEDIPLAARVVALADVYDALTSVRVYKNAMSHDEAREVILAGSATHFDPKIVEAFLAREADFRKVCPGT